MLAFEIAGGIEAGQALRRGARTCTATWPTSVTCARWSIHPASTTHSQLSPEQQTVAGVTPGLVRLAVGIEHIDDILADLEAGFRAAKNAWRR